LNRDVVPAVALFYLNEISGGTTRGIGLKTDPPFYF